MGVIGLDYPAVFDVARKLGMDVDPVMIRKIGAVEQEILSRIGKDEDKKRSDYCKACASLKQNTDCAACDIKAMTAAECRTK